MKIYMKRPISLIHFVLLAGLTATLSGCASNGMTRSGFLGDYDVLGKTKYENVLLFKAPGFEPSRYREILVEDAQVVTATGRIGGLEAEQVRELLDHVNSELRHLQTKSEAPASSGRIRVRVAITTIETPNRAVNTLTTLLVGPVSTGGASLEFVAVDEQSDRRVAAASCFEHGNALADFKGSYTLLGHAKSAITTCLERINSAWRSAGS